MFARLIVNRKWMVVAAAAAILALVIGSKVGRSIIPSSAESKVAPKPTQTRFNDRANGLSLSYPSNWARLRSRDPQARLVAALSPAVSLSMRVSKTELDDVTPRTVTLAAVRQFTDDLLGADYRAKLLSEPEPIQIGGLVGYRYRYSYTGAGNKAGAHLHYFLFKHHKIVQLVFQVLPATALAKYETAFNAIAGTMASTGR